MTKREKERRARQRSRAYANARKERQVRRAAAIVDNALGWRINEWCSLVGCSRPTVWRQSRDGKLKLIYVNKMPYVPRTEAIRLGFINA
jgi:hypothetical protein